MLVIRLQRRGRTGLAMYRIVVQDKRTHPSKEKVVARLGNYNPHTKELNVDKGLAQKFLDSGAQPSPRLAILLKSTGVKLPKWVEEAVKKSRTTRNAEKLRKNQPKDASAEEASEDEAPSEEPKEEVSEVESTEEPTEAPAETEEA